VIDEQFVPRRRHEISYVEVDDELVLAAPADGTRFDAHWLDRTASVVWQTFDGVASLGELIDDLADAFGADREVVAGDVLDLARTLGRAGLLDGIAAAPPVPAHRLRPEGLAIGTAVPAFAGRDLDGAAVRSDELTGTPHCLVHWSPTCGFCVRIAPELSALVPDLEAAGVELVLVSGDDAAANRELLASAGLRCRVIVEDPDAEEIELFSGLGTPCAYLVDAAGSIAAELAYGSVEVPALLHGLLAPPAP
jgi:peroxiredoxin